ncbi:MAG: carboxypeptidase regulatory-like domain-containing protein [Planctomycetota bacterium]|nr:MAG: carboxypeptidase regulatory-like domain-containing protein [Planctomycetota bacterium]
MTTAQAGRLHPVVLLGLLLGLAAFGWIAASGIGPKPEVDPSTGEPFPRNQGAPRGMEEEGAEAAPPAAESSANLHGVLPPDSPARTGLLGSGQTIVRGQVVAPTWTEFPNQIQIELLPQNGSEEPLFWTTLGGQERRFRFEPVPYGDWKLRMAAAGFETMVHLLTTSEKSPDQHVLLQLRLANKLQGKVVDARGAPVPGVVVTARATSKDPHRRTLPLRGISDDQGKFEISNLQPGSYQVHAGPYASALGETREIYVANGEAWVELSIPVIGRAQVRLLDTVSGKPLAGIKVSAQQDARGAPAHMDSGTSTADGLVVFPHLLPGEYTFSAFGTGYRRTLRRATVNPDGLTQVEIRLQSYQDEAASGG